VNGSALNPCGLGRRDAGVDQWSSRGAGQYRRRLRRCFHDSLTAVERIEIVTDLRLGDLRIDAVGVVNIILRSN
jgi:hypothetical protein